jgi:hypothetical protein
MTESASLSKGTCGFIYNKNTCSKIYTIKFSVIKYYYYLLIVNINKVDAICIGVGKVYCIAG